MLHGSGNMYQNTDLWFLKQDALDLMHSHGIFPVPSSQPVSLNLRNPDILLSGSHGKYGRLIVAGNEICVVYKVGRVDRLLAKT